jgi:hypothetical protein
MIPFDTSICELLEAVMAKEKENKNVKTLFETAMYLMLQTRRIYQSNLFMWTIEESELYSLRFSKFENVIRALTSIGNGNPTAEILHLGIRDSKALYAEINTDLSPEWDSACQERRSEILEEILLPLLLFTRFMERYERDKLICNEASEIYLSN